MRRSGKPEKRLDSIFSVSNVSIGARKCGCSSTSAPGASCETSDAPTESPRARNTSLAKAPVMKKWSYADKSDLMSGAFVSNFAPPKIANEGDAGERAACNSSTSRFIKSPAQCGKNFGIPTIDACTRCAAENASLMYISPSFATCDGWLKQFVDS